eukprot:Em0001g1940a
MLSKVATAEGQDWDKLLQYVLFAYREASERRPLDIVKETWQAPSHRIDESIVSYVLSVQERLAKMTELVKENLAQAQVEQKQWLPPYRLPYCYRDSVKEELGEMLKHGVIECSNSPCMGLAHGSRHEKGWIPASLHVDFRRINGVTRQDAYPMPRIAELIDRLGRAKVITTLDLSKGAPATFQRMMDELLRETEDYSLAYLDDIVITGKIT